MSVFLAKKGGNVFAIDNTINGVNDTLELAKFNGVKVNARVVDACEVDKIGINFDFVVGKFILHHIEPFNEFAEKLKYCMNDGATGLFFERFFSELDKFFYKHIKIFNKYSYIQIIKFKK